MIPYRTLDKEIGIIKVKRDQQEGLVFDRSYDPTSENAWEIRGLENKTTSAWKSLRRNFSPLFPYLDDMMQEIADKQTFFEHRKYFDAQEYMQKPLLGVHYSRERFDNGLRRDRGSHVKVGFDLRQVRSTLLHEWGHEMHLRCTQEGLTLLEYQDYDPIMREVFAFLLQRSAATRQENLQQHYKEDPHATALLLITSMEADPYFSRKPFRKKWRYLLEFAHHQELKKDIQRAA